MQIGPEEIVKTVDEKHIGSDDKPPHWKFKKQRVFTTARFFSKPTKVHGTQSSSQKFLGASMVEIKHNTRNKKILNKKSVIEFEVPIEDVVPVEESDVIDDEDNSEKDINDDVAKSVVAHRSKAKTGSVTLVKKATTKGVMIKKLGLSSGCK